MFRVLIRHGLENDLKNVTGLENEIVFTTDTMILFMWKENSWIPICKDSVNAKRIFENYFVTYVRYGKGPVNTGVVVDDRNAIEVKMADFNFWQRLRFWFYFVFFNKFS